MQPKSTEELTQLHAELLGQLREGAGRLAGGKIDPKHPEAPPPLRLEDARAMLADAETALQRVTRARAELVARYDAEIRRHEEHVALLRKRLQTVPREAAPSGARRAAKRSRGAE